MKRYIGGFVLVLGFVGIGLHVSSRSCGACPPVIWEVEQGALSIESMTVDGDPVEIPATYAEAEVMLLRSPLVPEDFWLQAEDDSIFYWATFR